MAQTLKTRRRLPRGMNVRGNTYTYDYHDPVLGRQRGRLGSVGLGESDEVRDMHFRLACDGLAKLQQRQRADDLHRASENPTLLATFLAKHDSDYIALPSVENKVGYRIAIESFVEAVDPKGTRRIETIDANDFRTWQTAEIKRGLKTSTTNARLKLLRAVFHRAKKWKQLRDDSFLKDVEPVSGQEANTRPRLTREQCDRIIECLEATVYGHDATKEIRALFQFCLATLARLSNALQLHTDQIQPDGQGGWLAVFQKTKTKKAHKVPVNIPTMALLNALPVSDDGYYFPLLNWDVRHGSVLQCSKVRVQRVFQQACAAATSADPKHPIRYGREQAHGIGIVWHRATRATGACLYLEGDRELGIEPMPLHEVQAIGGWDTLEAMQEYLGPLPANLSRGVNRWPGFGQKPQTDEPKPDQPKAKKGGKRARLTLVA